MERTPWESGPLEKFAETSSYMDFRDPDFERVLKSLGSTVDGTSRPPLARLATSFVARTRDLSDVYVAMDVSQIEWRLPDTHPDSWTRRQSTCTLCAGPGAPVPDDLLMHITVGHFDCTRIRSTSGKKFRNVHPSRAIQLLLDELNDCLDRTHCVHTIKGYLLLDENTLPRGRVDSNYPITFQLLTPPPSESSTLNTAFVHAATRFHQIFGGQISRGVGDQRIRVAHLSIYRAPYNARLAYASWRKSRIWL